MLIHSVFFYLREDLSAAQRAEFLHEGLEPLGKLGMEGFYVGTPAPVTRRPLVDSSYTFAMTCMFKDVASHDAYQAHPVHQAFVSRFKTCWVRVQIYDAA